MRPGALLAALIDRLAFRLLPVSVTPLWVRLCRGIYAGANAEMYLLAALWLRTNRVDGDLAEFGVGSGATASLLYRYLERCWPAVGRRYHLFDSFCGLPDDVELLHHPGWSAGAWSYPRAAVHQRLRWAVGKLDRFTWTAGEFTVSLDAETRSRLGLRRIALLHVDCDLEASTEAALEFVTPAIQDGTVALFDDFYCYRADRDRGEAAALARWCSRHHIEAVPWRAFSIHGQAFILRHSHAQVSPPKAP